ncbi:MAG TPA: signal peptidase I [Actinomycetota bacterium]|nr:signal peptidase I [Actinomycetota bacterium]
MAETTRAHEAAQEADDGPELPLEEPGRGSDDGSGGDPGPPKHRRSHDAEPEGGEERRWRFVGSTPFLILVALGVAILVKSFVIQAFYIPSESMVPTLEVGDRVFVNKFLFDEGDIHRGDVIVFENPNQGELPDRGAIGDFLHWLGEGIGFAQPENEDFIKRVVALPGETIEIRDDVVYIDSEPLDEPYLTEAAGKAMADYPLKEVPDGELFVMGDNRGNSADSRYGLGTVPVDRVIGKAFVVIWPPSHLGGV